MNLPYNKIILHHSKTKDGKTVSVDAIRKHHKEVNGWTDIGYHFLVEQIGDKNKILLGRSLAEYGSHCKLHNSGSVGCCVVGDFDSENLPEEKELLLIDLCVALCLILKINPKEIYGDRDFHPTKTCPGTKFPLKRIKESVSGIYISYQGFRCLLKNEMVKDETKFSCVPEKPTCLSGS